MSFISYSRGLVAAALVVLPTLTWAGDINVSDSYVRVSRPDAPTGAAFMIIKNEGTTDDRLIAVTSDVAKRVELHTHIDQGDGVLKMTQIEGGIELPAGEAHMLKRGGDHVMLMGLTKSLEKGDEITITFTFENAGDMTVMIPVDNERKPVNGHGAHGGDADHSGHSN
jgi:copper(I)-binding protein